jgi:hypothetical protein
MNSTKGKFGCPLSASFSVSLVTVNVRSATECLHACTSMLQRKFCAFAHHATDARTWWQFWHSIETMVPDEEKIGMLRGVISGSPSLQM